MERVILVVLLEIIVLRIFWIGALERIDKRVNEVMGDYLKVIKEAVKNSINQH